jgi:Domain of unknown function (DUF4062)
MARIYVSSTFTDLQEVRDQVRLTLRRLQHEDVAMEYYVAEDRRPLDRCLADVDRCDLYLGIFAWRYGFIPPGKDKSVTELEYRRARDNGKKCLVLLLDKKASWPVERIEFAAMGRIEALREELQQEAMTAFFTSGQDIGARVAEALSNWEKSLGSKLEEVERKKDVLPVQSNDLLTGPLTICAVLKGPERQIVGDAYPTGDNGVHFVFSLFNGNAFDFLVNELDVDVLAYAPLNLDHLAHGVGATAVRRYFRATIRPERGSYVATYVGRHGEFVTIPPGKSEGFDVEISTRTEGLYDVRLRVHGGSAGKGFDVPLDSTKRRVAFFDRGAGYMVDRGLGLGGRMLTYDEYSLEMKSWGLSDY